MDNSLPSRFSPSEIDRRARVRRDRMVGHRTDSFQDAEDWDLDFWQKAGAETRLSALVSLRNEVEIIEMGPVKYSKKNSLLLQITG